MRRFFLVFSVFISVFTQAETITPNITNPNVLFIVVTSNIMSSRYEDIIKGVPAYRQCFLLRPWHNTYHRDELP
jgi:hypothetical protein